ncbi:uncharacterized protein LOC144420825 [Styela clava]
MIVGTLKTVVVDPKIEDEKSVHSIESVAKPPAGPVSKMLQGGGDFLVDLEAQNLVQAALYKAKEDLIRTADGDEKDVILQQQAKVIVDEAIYVAMNILMKDPVVKQLVQIQYFVEEVVSNVKPLSKMDNNSETRGENKRGGKKSKTRRRGDESVDCATLTEEHFRENVEKEIAKCTLKSVVVDPKIEDEKLVHSIESVAKPPAVPVSKMLQGGGDFLVDLEAQNLVQAALYKAKEDLIRTADGDEKDVILQQQAKVIVDEAIYVAMNILMKDPVVKQLDIGDGK